MIGYISDNLLIPILDFFYGLVPSYGLAIVALTLVIRVALYPLSAGSIRSARRMRIAQPVIQKRQAEIKSRYADDIQKQQQELGKVMKEFGSPLAGCLPLLVDCPTSVRPFDERVHYPSFTLYYPLERIVERPNAFVRCLHALQTEPQHRERLRRWRRALQVARRELIYGWYDPLPPPNASLAEPAWADATLWPGRVLDNVLLAATTDPTQRAAPRNHWERRSRASMAHGLPGDAERMRAHSLEAVCSKA